MRYEKNARKAGIFNTIIGVMVLFALIALQVFFFPRPDFPLFVVILVWIIGGLVVLVFIGQGLSLLNSGGQWDIVIDNKGINWSSPNDSVDKSFDVKFSEISRLETRQRVKKSGKIRSHNYVLILHNGSEIKLSPNSGINLTQVALELERKGVVHEFVKVC